MKTVMAHLVLLPGYVIAIVFLIVVAPALVAIWAMDHLEKQRPWRDR